MDSSVIVVEAWDLIVIAITLVTLLIPSFVRLIHQIPKRKEVSEENDLREQLRYGKRKCVFDGCQEYASASYEYEESTDSDVNRQPLFTAVEWQGHSKFTMYFCVDHLVYTVRSVIKLVAVPLKKQRVFLYNDPMKNQGRLRGLTAADDGFTDGPGPVTIYNSTLRIECVKCGRGSLGDILMFDDGRKYNLDYDGDAELFAKLLEYCPYDKDVFVLYGYNDTLEEPVELARGDPYLKCSYMRCNYEAKQAMIMRLMVPSRDGDNKAESLPMCTRHYKAFGLRLACTRKRCDLEAKKSILAEVPPKGSIPEIKSFPFCLGHYNTVGLRLVRAIESR